MANPSIRVSCPDFYHYGKLGTLYFDYGEKLDFDYGEKLGLRVTPEQTQ